MSNCKIQNSEHKLTFVTENKKDYLLSISDSDTSSSCPHAFSSGSTVTVLTTGGIRTGRRFKAFGVTG